MEREHDDLSVTEVMKMLHVSRTTIHRRVKQGKLKPINQPSPALERNPNWKFRREDIESLLHGSEADTSDEDDEEPENNVA